MIRYYCDRCKCELLTSRKYKVTIKDFAEYEYLLCEDCKNEIRKYMKDLEQAIQIPEYMPLMCDVCRYAEWQGSESSWRYKCRKDGSRQHGDHKCHVFKNN